MKLFILAIFVCFSLAATASAASLSLAAPDTVAVGERFSVDVVAETGGVPINSVEASVVYDSAALEYLGYQEDAGVVRFWIRQPAARDGTVTFAGGIPGGASRAYGAGDGALTVTRLLFMSKRAGDAPLALADSSVLVHDGRGTALPHTLAGANVSVSGAIAGVESPADATPPEPFAVSVLSRDRASGTPILLVFGAVDDETGISGYRVRLGWGPWQAAQSPQPAPRRLFSYTAAVEATDLAGNTRQERATVPGIVPIPFIAGIALLIVSGLGVYFVVKRKV